jgi:hypothetical protein
MLKRFKFGDFIPDQPLTLGGGKNAQPTANGWMPVKAPSPITPALAGILGGAAFVSSSGTAALLAGDATNLYRYSGTAWTSLLGSLSATVWRFDQFGDNIICVNGGAPVSFDLAGGTAAALGGSPPVSDMVATVREQVFLAGDPSARNTLSISSYNNSAGWTAGTNQCLFVPFPSGGDIMGLCGGETGLILQKRSVKRATYTGDVTVWQFDEISKDIGCMAKGSVAQAGQLVFFLSEQGFKLCDRTQVVPIGQEKVDRTFFARYSRSQIDNITAAVDPRTTTVYWAMPGNPGQIWPYNWTLEKWGLPIEIPLARVFSGFTANISLDALDALYPSGLDSIPYSLDAAIFAGGNPLFIVADNAGVLNTLTGDNLAAEFILSPDEPQPGRRVRIRSARPVSDAVTGTVTIDARARAGDAHSSVTSGAMRDNGRVPLRANGRHIGVTHDIPDAAVWSYAIGLELEFEAEGAR